MSASSCIDLSALTSVVPFDDLTSSYSMNPPVTTISISFWCMWTQFIGQEMRQISFIVSQWQIIFPVIWKRHITTLNKSSNWSSRFVTACSGGTFDCLFPIAVEYNLYPLVLWTCFQYCTNACVSQMSKCRCIVRFSQSYNECLSIDDNARYDVSWSSIASGQFMPVVITFTRADLFPVRSVPFISAIDNGTGRSSCFNTDGKSTGRPALYDVIRRWRTFLSAFSTTFLSLSLVFLTTL